MLRNLFIFLLLIAAVAAGFVAMQPAEFLISRTRTFAAPPEVVFPYVNDLHKWALWSPWEKLDPSMKREYSGPPEGLGASYHWVGNDQVGEGRMTITDSSAPDKVVIRLEFVKPYPATNEVQFYIDRGGLGTDVTWAMTGHNDFVAKAFALFMNMEKQVGRDFEKGLTALDAVTAAATPPAPPAEPDSVEPESPENPESEAPAASG
jgi:uncharacterized protein YndB with AHSA1/START domain